MSSQRMSAPFLGAMLVDVRPLSKAEVEESCLGADTRVRLLLAQHGLGPEVAERVGLLERAFERAVVLRATVSPGVEDAVPFFASIEDVEELDASTMTTLFDTWEQVQDLAHDPMETDHP